MSPSLHSTCTEKPLRTLSRWQANGFLIRHTVDLSSPAVHLPLISASYNQMKHGLLDAKAIAYFFKSTGSRIKMNASGSQNSHTGTAVTDTNTTGQQQNSADRIYSNPTLQMKSNSWDSASLSLQSRRSWLKRRFGQEDLQRWP